MNGNGRDGARTAERRAVLVVGASAGALPALTAMVGDLPSDLSVSVLVTMHVPEHASSRLPRILSRAGSLTATAAAHAERLEPGRIYVAPPGRHVLVDDGAVRLSGGPRVNRHRPAIDVMFASAAHWAGPGVVAVVLSGVLDDGAVGAALVARAGGTVVVQDPGSAEFDMMPRAALAAAPGAISAAPERLGALVRSLIDERADRASAATSRPTDERGAMTASNSEDNHLVHGSDAQLSDLVCPDCGGSLARYDLSGIHYYRCHVGHQYGPQSLEAAQAEAVETKLWTAVAALEEHAALAQHLAERHGAHEQRDVGARYLRSARRSTRLAELVHAELDAPPPR